MGDAPATDRNATDGGFGTPERTTENPKLEHTLVGLVRADDRTEYADRNDLTLRNGSVEVVVELRPDRTLPSDHPVDVTARHDRLVQAFVPVDGLEPLAAHANVSYVRTPRRAQT